MHVSARLIGFILKLGILLMMRKIDVTIEMILQNLSKLSI